VTLDDVAAILFITVIPCGLSGAIFWNSITLVLLSGGYLSEFVVLFWVILACAIAITLGILSGGWRIVRSVGFGIFKVRPIHAFDGQLTSAAVIFGASMAGAPVSTTHVVSSSLMELQVFSLSSSDQRALPVQRRPARIQQMVVPCRQNQKPYRRSKLLRP